MTQVEDRLARAAVEVREQVSKVPSRNPGWVVRRNRSNLGGPLLLAAMTLIVIVAGSVLLLRPSDKPAANQKGIPPLIVDAHQLGSNLDLVLADDETVKAPIDSVRFVQLRSYGKPGADITDPRVWVVSYPDGSDFFRSLAQGEESAWEVVEVPSGQAYLLDEGLLSTVMWNPSSEADGEVLQIEAFGIPTAALKDVVNSMENTGSEWSPRDLPDGFVDLYTGPSQLLPGERLVEFVWFDPSKAGEITLSMYQGNDSLLERNLFGFLPYAPGTNVSIEPVEIRGHTGVQFELDDNVFVYQWMETPDVFARLLIEARTDSDQVINALVEIDPQAWRDTIETGVQQADNGGTVQTTMTPTTTDITP